MACLGFAGAAKADFIVSSSRVPNRDDVRYEIVEFFTKNEGANATGSKAIASDITVKDLSGGKLLFKFVAVGGADANADLTGVAAPVDAAENVVPDRSFVNLLANDGKDDASAYAIISSVPDSHQHMAYALGVPQFEVVGASLSGGVNATTSN